MFPRPVVFLLALLTALARPAEARRKFDPELERWQKKARALKAPLGAPAADPRVRALLRLAPGIEPNTIAAAHPGLRVTTRAGAIVAAEIPLSALARLERDGRVESVSVGRRSKPVLDVARSSSTSSGGLQLGLLKNGLGDLSNADGSGIVVGIVDSGIDFRHGDFIDSGGNSRILSIWDQTDSAGTPPAGYVYGSEWSQAEIDDEIDGSPAGVVTQVDDSGHGTHVAGIAAGDGSATGGAIPAGTYKGLASGADLIVVKTDFSDTGVLNGVDYIIAAAQAANKRAVINLSLGKQEGGHDGTQALEAGLGAIAASTPIVVAAGNDQELGPHARTTIGIDQSETFGVDASNASGDTLYVEFWHPNGDEYTASVSLTCSPACATPVSAAYGNDVDDAPASGGPNPTVDLHNGTNAPLGGDRRIYVEVYDPGAVVTGITVVLTRTANGGSGRVDGYTESSVVGTEFTTFADSEGTISNPATANDVFAVGAYNSRQIWPIATGAGFYDPALTLGAIASFSGRGPSRDGRQKPDIAAPGQGIASARSADISPAPAAATLIRDGQHLINQGTSMAAPAAAGFIALKMQVNPGATVAAIRQTMQAHARTDAQTSAVPNSTWGYGKLLGTPLVQTSPTQLLTVVDDTDTITYSWQSPINAYAYDLFYSTNTSSVITTSSATTFTFRVGPNFLTGIRVHGQNATGRGPGATSPSTSTLALPITGAPVITPHVSSATIAFTPCPAAPSSDSCGGYVIQASLNAGFTGVALSSATSNRESTSLQIPGLSASTAYYFRIATLNQSNGANFTALGSATTLTNLQPPGSAAAAFSSQSQTQIRYTWTAGANPSNTTFRVEMGTAPDFTGSLLSAQSAGLLTNVFTGLSANTSYYFRVQGFPSGPYLTEGPSATLAYAPALSTSPFTDTRESGLQLNWAAGGNPADTLHEAEVAAVADFSAVLLSSFTRNLHANFLAGLSPNTTYYARVRSISHGGAASSSLALGSTATLAMMPMLSATESFFGLSQTGFSAQFLPEALNPADTVHRVRLSTDPAFGAVAAQALTTGVTAAFSGLSSNLTYYAQVEALNRQGLPSAPLALGSTIPYAAAPAAAAASSQTTAALRFNWGSGGNAAGGEYLAEMSADGSFSVVDQSSVTRNLFADFTGLGSRVRYYARVRALAPNPPHPDGALTDLGSTYTLPDPPTYPGTPIVSVTYASVTVNWIQPGAGAAGYRVQAAADAGFTLSVRSADFGPSATEGGVSGLSADEDYFVRVGAISDDGSAVNYAAALAATTLAENSETVVVLSTGFIVNVVPSYGVLTNVGVAAPGGVFPAGTVVRLNTSVELDLPVLAGDQAAALTPLGSGIGFSVTAAGLQPNGAVRVSMRYDSAQLPAGRDPHTIVVARYDEAARRWRLLPTTVDAANRYIIAELDHFSLFAPFFATAGAGTDHVRVFPLPWQPGSGDARFDAATLTIAGAPPDARLRVMTLKGELVWEGRASPGGIASWHGLNRYGRKAASGTYLLLIEGGGDKSARRVVLTR